MIDLHYPEKDWLRVNTDGSQLVEAGVHCKLFLQYATVGVNKSNFEGEIQITYTKVISINFAVRLSKFNCLKQVNLHLLLKHTVTFETLNIHAWKDR